MADAPTMRFSYVDRVFVGVHTAKNPRPAEWSAHCASIERLRNETRGCLVYTLGGGPSSKQREEMRVAFHEQPAPPTAIMTSSALVRGIITSLNWFLADKIAAFEPAELAAALQYLERGTGALDRDKLVSTLVSLADELALKLPSLGEKHSKPQSRF
jgi:hypothetical protein